MVTNRPRAVTVHPDAGLSQAVRHLAQRWNLPHREASEAEARSSVEILGATTDGAVTWPDDESAPKPEPSAEPRRFDALDRAHKAAGASIGALNEIITQLSGPAQIRRPLTESRHEIWRLVERTRKEAATRGGTLDAPG
jgi:hypothetical protein